MYVFIVCNKKVATNAYFINLNDNFLIKQAGMNVSVTKHRNIPHVFCHRRQWFLGNLKMEVFEYDSTLLIYS
jgi:hypothetical protein